MRYNSFMANRETSILPEIPEPNGAAPKPRPTISLAEVLLALFLSSGACWLLLLLFANADNQLLGFDSTEHQLFAVALAAGIGLAFAASFWMPLKMRSLTKHILVMAIASTLCCWASLATGHLLGDAFHIPTFAILLLLRIMLGFCAGVAFIWFVCELVILALRTVMAVSGIGMAVAMICFLLLYDLEPIARLIALAILPIAAAVLGHALQQLNTRYYSDSASPGSFVALTFLSNLRNRGKSGVGQLTHINRFMVLEKSFGLLIYGFTAGIAVSAWIASIKATVKATAAYPSTGQELTGITDGLSFVLPLELLLTAVCLGVSVRFFSARHHLRLPQWSYYVIAILGFLVLPLGSTDLRIVASGALIATAVYYYTIDILVLTYMNRDMGLDPCEAFGWYGSTHMLAVIAGGVVFLVADSLSASIGDFSLTVLPLLVVALIAWAMSAMRWMYYDSVSKHSRPYEAGYWKRRLEKVSIDYNLTQRESEILELLVRGRSVRFIREQLIVSDSTVKTHVNNIYHKLGIHNRQQLISLFEEHK